jgi:hypothetical protein
MNALAAHLAKVEEALGAIVNAPPAAAATPPAPAMIELKQADVVGYITGEIAKAKDEKDEEKAKKRLAHLHKNVVALSKFSWESTESAKIPEYQEPNLTAKTEESDKTITPVAQPDNVMHLSFGKVLADLQKAVDALTAQAAPAVETPAAPDPNASFWPKDVNSATFMKEGVNKRGGAGTDAWGADPWASQPAK